jgi:peptidase E
MTRSRPSDIFLIAGGMQSKNNKEILAEVLALIKKKTPSVAYIGTASGDNKEFFFWISQLFMAAGAGNVSLVPIVRRFDPDKARDILFSSDVVFISGGDVCLGMKYLRSRKLVSFLREIYDRGKFFCGVSAGAIMLCRNWMNWRDPDDDDTVELLDCLGFARLLCDVHAEEDNWVEMKRLLGFFPQGTAGYGIPANGALRVSPDGKITSIGSAPVQFIKKDADIIEERKIILSESIHTPLLGILFYL